MLNACKLAQVRKLSPTLAVLESSWHNKAEEVLSLFLLFPLFWTRAPHLDVTQTWDTRRRLAFSAALS